MSMELVSSDGALSDIAIETETRLYCAADSSVANLTTYFLLESKLRDHQKSRTSVGALRTFKTHLTFALYAACCKTVTLCSSKPK